MQRRKMIIISIVLFSAFVAGIVIAFIGTEFFRIRMKADLLHPLNCLSVLGMKKRIPWRVR